MIVVIADDLTGAAEIGGIALRYGLSAEVVTGPVPGSDADVLIISTDTRSMPEAEALKVTEAVSHAIFKLNPAFVYKKVDSVLRGHVVAELNIHKRILNYKRALLVPVNPALGRIITSGEYYVNGKPIHETDFANDPEFPATSAEIHKILRAEKDGIFTVKPGEALPASGIVVGEAADNDDLEYWAKTIDRETLAAGSAVFFLGILESMGHHKIQHKNYSIIDAPSLIVCGSSHEKSRNLVERSKNNGQPVSYMPAEVISCNAAIAYDKWADEIVSLIKKNKTAIIAIDNSSVKNHEITAAELRNKKAVVIEKVFAKVNLKELIIEGGSTAAAIIKQLNFSRFFPVDEPGAGVIKMKVAPYNNLFLTLKPGSYNWPAHIWNF